MIRICADLTQLIECPSTNPSVAFDPNNRLSSWLGCSVSEEPRHWLAVPIHTGSGLKRCLTRDSWMVVIS